MSFGLAMLITLSGHGLIAGLAWGTLMTADKLPIWGGVLLLMGGVMTILNMFRMVRAWDHHGYLQAIDTYHQSRTERS